MKPIPLLIVLAALLLAGCTSPEDLSETVYTHQWAYGPGYAGGGALPVFEDAFTVDDEGDLMVTTDWSIDAGRAAIELTPPGGETENLSAEATGGPRGSGEAGVAGTPGTWGFRIPTWRAEDGAFPAGFVEVQVTRSPA